MRLLHDLRYALRMLRKDAAFTVVAVLSLALGTGANATMFSMVNAVLLRPLPVSRPDEVLTIAPKAPRDPFDAISYPDYADFRDRSRTMKDLVATALSRFGFSSSSDTLPKIKYGLMVSGNLFQAMDVSPVLGRFFRPDETVVPGRDAVVVLGYDFWTDEFGGDSKVIGRVIQLNGLDFTVIGVAPETFTGMDEFFKVTMFVPAMMAPRLSADPDNNLLVHRDWNAFVVKGRLKPGVSLPQAEAELVSIAKGLEEAYPATDAGRSVSLVSETQLHFQHLPQESGFMILAMAMAGLVLLTSCFNVANLLLSRARKREVAVRLALGAGRTGLLRQLLSESLLLAIGGAIAGLWFGWIAAGLFNRIRVPSDLPFMFDFKTDHRVLVLTLVLGVLNVLFFGLMPALQSSKINLVSALKAADDAGGGRKRLLWGRNLLVVGQIAISVVLLVATALVYHGFSRQFLAGTGFRTNHLLTMSFDPRLIRYTDHQISEFYRQLIDQSSLAPGVKSVTMSAIMPLAINQRSFTIDVARAGLQSAGNRNTKDHILYNVVDEHFFDTLAIPIIKGRGFDDSDKEESPPVVVVNESLAAKYWPGEDAVGKRIQIDLDGGRTAWAEVVGVAKLCKYVWMTEGPTNYLYLPLSQNPRRQRVLLAQAYGDPAGLTGTLRKTISSLDPNMPLFDVRTMEEFFTSWVVGSANDSIVIVGSMGVIGLILSMIGLYGLVTYSVSRRTREFGIRMAIGATGSSVLGMVLREGAGLCLTGVAIGVAVSFPASRLLKAFVFSANTDWLPYAVIPILLFVVTLIATYGPARRAATINPIRALRDE